MSFLKLIPLERLPSVCVCVGLETVSVSSGFSSTASQNDYRINANQELLAIGMTNFMGSFVSAYPVTGSFGRCVCVCDDHVKLHSAICLVSVSRTSRKWSIIFQFSKCTTVLDVWGAVGRKKGLWCRVVLTLSSSLLRFRTAVNSQSSVCTPAGGIVTSEFWHFTALTQTFSALLWTAVVSPPITASILSPQRSL